MTWHEKNITVHTHNSKASEVKPTFYFKPVMNTKCKLAVLLLSSHCQQGGLQLMTSQSRVQRRAGRAAAALT